jgi:multidrug efflux pump subunit AcrA (membrane-fusion protein)
MKYKSKKVTQKSLIWAAVALALAGGSAKYFWPADNAQAKSAVQMVTTFVVEQRDFPVVLDATGSTVAANIVDIRPQVTNVVAKVHIKEGQMVKAGDMLISLDDRADRANYDKAQATADDAQRQLNRAEELLRQQFVAQGAVIAQCRLRCSRQCASCPSRCACSASGIEL